LKIQCPIEEIKDINNENAKKANIPERDIAGILNQPLEKPANAKVVSLNPGTIKVTRYKVIANPTHLKRPKVIRLRGKISMFIIGLIISEDKLKTTPVRSIE
jgi:hypothetical protein